MGGYTSTTIRDKLGNIIGYQPVTVEKPYVAGGIVGSGGANYDNIINQYVAQQTKINSTYTPPVNPAVYTSNAAGIVAQQLATGTNMANINPFLLDKAIKSGESGISTQYQLTKFDTLPTVGDGVMKGYSLSKTADGKGYVPAYLPTRLDTPLGENPFTQAKYGLPTVLSKPTDRVTPELSLELGKPPTSAFNGATYTPPTIKGGIPQGDSGYSNQPSFYTNTDKISPANLRSDNKTPVPMLLQTASVGKKIDVISTELPQYSLSINASNNAPPSVQQRGGILPPKTGVNPDLLKSNYALLQNYFDNTDADESTLENLGLIDQTLGSFGAKPKMRNKKHKQLNPKKSDTHFSNLINGILFGDTHIFVKKTEKAHTKPKTTKKHVKSPTKPKTAKKQMTTFYGI